MFLGDINMTLCKQEIEKIIFEYSAHSWSEVKHNLQTQSCHFMAVTVMFVTALYLIPHQLFIDKPFWCVSSVKNSPHGFNITILTSSDKLYNVLDNLMPINNTYWQVIKTWMLDNMLFGFFKSHLNHAHYKIEIPIHVQN